MLRTRLTDDLKTNMREKNMKAVSTIRLVIAKLKEKDIESRTLGKGEEIDEAAIISMMQGMIKQRRESVEMYTKGGRPELAQGEADEIAVIETYLPKQMDEAEMKAAIQAVITEIGAAGGKDMGRVMGELKTRHAGTIDFSKVNPLVKSLLG